MCIVERMEIHENLAYLLLFDKLIAAFFSAFGLCCVVAWKDHTLNKLCDAFAVSIV